MKKPVLFHLLVSGNNTEWNRIAEIFAAHLSQRKSAT
jgi:hypothetical protein